jgi:hypothetical protein
MRRIKAFYKEFRKHTVVAILAAFAFLIALAWRDFFSEFINYLIENSKLSGEAYIFQLVSAILITIIAVLGIMVISKINVDEDAEEAKEKVKKKK